MKNKEYSKNVKLFCPLCGNDQFSTLDQTNDLLNASDDTRIQCSDCKSIYTKAQLIKENEHIINANMEEVKNEVMKDLEKEIKKMFK